MSEDADIDRFVASYTDEIQVLIEALRQLIKQVAPKSHERLHPGWKVISYSHQQNICSIAPHAKWVNVQFVQGTSLDDATNILQGTGKTMRHVKVKQPADISTKLRVLIKQSAVLAEG